MPNDSWPVDDPRRSAGDAGRAGDRRDRSGHVTPRGMVDCMIAAVALRREAALLSNDADTDRLARVAGSTWTEHRCGRRDPA